MSRRIETESDAADLLHAAKTLAVVSAWSALGYFERLRKGPLRRAELGADPRALAATVPVLLHVGLLATDGDVLALTPAAERLLREGAMPTERNLSLLRDLGKMTEVVRDGGPVKDDQGRARATRGGTTDDPAYTEKFLDMLYRMSAEDAASTYAWLAPHLPAGGAMLDLGGGHGRYARFFADAGFTSTVFDQPHVVTIAKKRHGDRLGYLEGDFNEVEGFGGPYDLVLLCNVVHGEPAESNAKLLARAARSVRPGGLVAVRDMFLDDLEQDPQSAVFFALTMLFYTPDGASHSTSAVRRWLGDAGLVDARIVTAGSRQIAFAKKP